MRTFNQTANLCHHGIRGQKWGVRRFQNPDGTLTPAGRKRYDPATPEEIQNRLTDKMLHPGGHRGPLIPAAKPISADGGERKDPFAPSLKNGKDKPPISPAEKILKDSGSAIDNAVKLSESISGIKNRGKGSGTNRMTDDELRKAIARMELERRYDSLSSERVDKGMTYTKDILTMTGSVVGITASVFGIISTVKGLKG